MIKPRKKAPRNAIFGAEPEHETRWSGDCAMRKRRRPAIQWWQGFQAITHASSYRSDETAGQGAVHKHCIGHRLLNICAPRTWSREIVIGFVTARSSVQKVAYRP